MLLGGMVAQLGVAQAVNFYGTFTSFTQSAVLYGNGIAADANANLYLTGTVNLGYIPRNSDGTYGAFLSPRIDTSGSGVYGLAIDAGNNLYRVDYSANVVARFTYQGVNNFARSYINANGTVTASPLAGWVNPSSVAVDNAGDVYVLNSGNGSVVKLTPNGASYTASTLYAGSALVAAAGLSVDTAGNLYFTSGPTSSALPGYASSPTAGVYKLSPGCGGYCQTSLGAGWSSPSASAVDSAGNLWVADHGAGVVYLLIPSNGGYTQTAWATIPLVSRLTISSSGQLLAITDGSQGNSVVWIGGTAPHNFGLVNVGSNSATAGVVVNFASTVNSATFSVLTQGASGLDFADAGGDTCVQNQTYSAGSSCTIYVRFNPKAPGLRSGALVVNDATGSVMGANSLYGTGTAPIVAMQGASPATFISGISGPASMMFDASGNLLVASNTASGNVYKYSSAGNILKVFPRIYGPVAALEDSVGNVFTYSSGGCCSNSLVEYTSSGATLAFPMSTSGQIIASLVEDTSGNFYLPDTHGTAAGLIKLTPNGSGYSESHLLPSQTVYALAIDGSGNLFATTANNAIWKITPDGSSTQIVSAGLNLAFGIAADVAGNLYVTNYGSNSVVEILAAGGYQQQSVLASGFTPQAVALDAQGNVYIGDLTNSRIVKLDRTTASLTFDAATVGSQSVDSPKSAVFENIGNAALTVPAPSQGANPAVTSGFALDSATTCPVVSASASAATLGAGATCFYEIDAIPAAPGVNAGYVTLSDNNLGVTGSSQSVTLTATGLGIKNIAFPALASPVIVGSTVNLGATASNGDPVTYTVLSGSATVSGSTVTFTATGAVTIEAGSPATSTYGAATPVAQSVTVNPAPTSYAAPTTGVEATSTTQTATVNFTTGGTLGSISVLTQGATGKDFNLAPGGACTVGMSYAAGQACTVNYTFAPQHPGLRIGAVQLVSSAGAVLGTSLISGTATGPQLTFLPPASTSLGSGFQSPTGLAVDGNGDIYVADHNHGMLKEILAVNGSIPSNPSITILASGIGANGLALDGAGNLYFADTDTGSVKALLAVGGVIPSNPSIVTLATGFTTPNGLALDAYGNLFVVDSSALTITKIPAGCNTSVTPGCATPLTGLSSTIGGAIGIAVDPNGNLFVGNGNNHLRTVLEIHAVNGVVPTNGAVVTQVTSLVHPYAVAVDANGNLFVADYASAVYELLAVNGQLPASPTVLTVFNGVTYADGIALDASGNIFVSDTSASIHELNVSTPPAMSFGSQVIDSTSPAQTLTLINRGNAPLDFQVPAAPGLLNPSLPAGFVYGSGSTCSLIGAGSSGFSLAPGSACTQLISFAPAVLGSFGGAIQEQTNNLNSAGATQSVSVSGTGMVLPNTIQFPQLPSPAVVGTSVSLAASSTSGQVSYSVTSGAATITGSTLVYTDSGTVTITASSPGSGNYAAASPVSWTVNVSPAPSSYLAPATAVAATSDVQTATVNFTTGGTLGSISVLTQGATGKDFNLAPGGACTVGMAYTAGQACTVNYTFTPLSPGTREGAVVLNGPGGSVLGTSYLGGVGTGPLGLFTTATQTLSIAGLNSVRGISLDGYGNLYGFDTAPGVVAKFAAGNTVETVLARLPGSSAGGATAVDGAGNLFVMDTAAATLYEFVGAAGPAITVASGIPAGDDNLEVDGSGNLYYSGYGSSPTGAIYKVAAGTHQITTLVQGNLGHRFVAMAVDPGGNIFAPDFNGNVLYELPAGSNTLVARVSGGFLSNPHGVAVDPAGNVYVANYNGSQVIRYASGTYAATLLPALGQRGVALDGAGNLYTITSDSTIAEFTRTHANPFSFANTMVGTSRDSQQGVVFENDGNADLAVTGYSATAPFALNGSQDTCGVGTLASGASCIVGASFSPANVGPQSGTATITDNTLGVAGTAQTIGLSGTAIQGSQSITFSALAPATYGDGPIALSATGGPSGNPVTFGVVSGPGSISGNVLAVTGAGSIVIAANQAASTNYMAAPQVTQTLVVYKAAKSIAFPALLSPVIVNSPASLTATTSNGDSVVYTVVAGAASISGTTVTFTNAGNVTIAADSPATANYLAAATATQTITVNAAPVSYTAPATSVGSASSVQTATVNFTAGGTLGAISVVTQGATGRDFNMAAGGACSAGTTYTAGQACTINYTFAPLAPGTREGAIVLSDSGGNLLGASYLGGIGNGPLGVFTRGAISTAVNASGGVYDIVEDGSGNLYVNNSGTVRKIAAGTQNQTVLATNAQSGALGIDGAGNVYYNVNNQLVKLVAGTSNAVTLTGQLCFIDIGITVDAQGNIYLPCTNGRDRIIRLAAGTLAETDYGLGSLNHPIGVSVDGSGNMFVSDNGNSRIAEITPANVVTTVAAIPSPGRNTFDAAGNLLVAHQNSTIVKFAPGFASSTTIPTGVGFSYSFAMDPTGNLFVLSNGGQIDLVARNTAAEPFGGITPAGTSSAGAPIAFENDGNQILQISAISAGANNFSVGTPVASSGSSAAQLVPAGTLSIPLSFTPQSVGNLSDALSIADNSLNADSATQQAALSGTATQQTPSIAASPAAIDYSSNPTTLSASVSFIGSIVPTGAVTFSIDGGAPVPATCTGSSSPLNCTASYPTGTLSVPTHTIQVSIASDADFNAASGTATLTVNPIAPAISFTVSNHTYGDAPTILAATSNSTGSFTYSLVSGPATISGSTLTITGAGPVTVQASQAASGNYTTGTLNASFTISPAQLKVAIAGMPAKTYDATTAAVLAPSNFAVTGLVGSDSIAINQPVGAYTSAHAGAENVTASLAAANYAAVSGSLSNYILPTSATGAGLINQAVAAVTPTSVAKVYGAADPALTGTLTGFVAADNVTATFARAAGETVLGGPYAISATLAPAAVLSNYNITYNTAQFAITAAPASVTPNGATKVYGTADPVLTGTLLGFVPADNVVAAFTRSAGETVLGGPYAIRAALAPAAVLSNYNITYNTASFTITPAPATVNFGNVVQTYNSGPLAPTVTTAPAGVSYSVAGAPDIAAGSYSVTATITDPNYTGSGSTPFTILQAPSTIVLSNLSQVYSGNPASAIATVTPAYCGPAAIAYNGTAAAPSSIGTYSVIATMANPNCTAPNATGALIINAFAATSCVYALNPTAHSTFSVSNGSSVVAQCSIQVNSAARDAFDVDGHGATVNATAISVVGGATVDRSSAIANAPVTGQTSAADPLAAVIAPTVGTCIGASNHDWDGDDNRDPQVRTLTLNPGTYCGGIAIHSRSAVTFNPGTYILLGGGLTIDGGAQVTGAGVTFYNTADRTHPYQPVHIDGGSKTALSAPISGPLAGVLFFQDRNLAQKDADHDRDNDNDNNHAQPNVITGNSESTFAGALYFPTTPLVYSGGSEQDPAAYTLIVADTISVAAHSNVSLTVLGKPMSDTDPDACSPASGKDCDSHHDGDQR